jgi:formylglycine-generating enzyme required for sulfatase activity
VWEWTLSAYRPYPYLAQSEREDEDESVRRTGRGGSRSNNRRMARCAFRDWINPDRFDLLGFRPVLSLADSGF